jgi:hypothetical protein
MTLQEAIQFLKTRMKNNTAGELDEIITQEMAFVQTQELERAPFFPWFLETEMAATVTTFPDERRVPLPDDFISELESSYLHIVLEDKTYRVEKVDGEYLGSLKNDYGVPEYYDIRGDYFILYPTPDAEYQLRMSYVGRQPLCKLPEDTNAWLEEAGQWFLGRVGENISLNVLGDGELAQRFQYMAETGKQLVRDLDIERRETNRERQMGVR